jgi:hypothetical protein
MMKVAACLDDVGYTSISALIHQLDELVTHLINEESDSSANVRTDKQTKTHTPPHLTIIDDPQT